MMLDLVVPFYNPQPGWEEKFARQFTTLIDRYFAGNRDQVHVIIVNDGSNVHFSEKEINYLEQYIPRLKPICYKENKGKGYALRAGVEHTLTDYCIYSDNDFPFGLEVIPAMLQQLQNGVDIVTGRRTLGNYLKSLPLKRKMASRGLELVNKYVLRLPVTDTQAGIKGFNKYGRALFLRTRTNRFLFDMEFIMIAGRIRDIVIRELDVNITTETKLTDFSRKILQQEFSNLVKIILRKKHEKQSKEDLI